MTKKQIKEAKTRVKLVHEITVKLLIEKGRPEKVIKRVWPKGWVSAYKEMRPFIYKNVKAGMSIEDAVSKAHTDLNEAYGY